MTRMPRKVTNNVTGSATGNAIGGMAASTVGQQEAASVPAVVARARYVSPQCAGRRCAECTQHVQRPPEPEAGISFDPCTHECHTRWPGRPGGSR